MPKWKIIIPVIIVLLVGMIAYLQLSQSSRTGGQGANAPIGDGVVTPKPSEQADEVAPVTGKEPIDVQADALVENMMAELSEEQSAAGDGSQAVGAVENESNADIFNVNYYE